MFDAFVAHESLSGFGVSVCGLREGIIQFWRLNKVRVSPSATAPPTPKRRMLLGTIVSNIELSAEKPISKKAKRPMSLTGIREVNGSFHWEALAVRTNRSIAIR